MSRRPCSIALLGMILLADPTWAEEKAVLKGHGHTVSAAAFFPDGKTLATGSWDKTIRLWEADTGKPLHTLTGHADYVLAVRALPEQALIAASPRDLKGWDLKTNKERWTRDFHRQFNPAVLTLSADGQLLACGGRDGLVRVWHIDKSELKWTLTGHQNWVSSLAFSKDGKRLAAGGRDGALRVWDLDTGKEKGKFAGHDATSVSAVAFSPDGKTLASGGYDAMIKLWDSETGKDLANLTGHKGVIMTLLFSPDGKELASGERHAVIKLWTLSNNQTRVTLPGHTGNLGFSISALAFSPDGRWLATGGHDSLARIWDTTVK